MGVSDGLLFFWELYNKEDFKACEPEKPQFTQA